MVEAALQEATLNIAYTSIKIGENCLKIYKVVDKVVEKKPWNIE